MIDAGHGIAVPCKSVAGRCKTCPDFPAWTRQSFPPVRLSGPIRNRQPAVCQAQDGLLPVRFNSGFRRTGFHEAGQGFGGQECGAALNFSQISKCAMVGSCLRKLRFYCGRRAEGPKRKRVPPDDARCAIRRSGSRIAYPQTVIRTVSCHGGRNGVFTPGCVRIFCGRHTIE